jgi:inosose dehydratase
VSVRIQIANAPCSWGVLEFEGMAAPADASQVLDEIAASGFAGTELGDWGFLPTDPGALAATLDSRGLRMVGGFVPVALGRPEAADPGIRAAVQTAELMAAVAPDALVVLADDNGADPVRTSRAGRITPADGLDDAALDRAAAVADRLARAVHEQTGLRTVFHHHAAGFFETPQETAALLSRTDPRTLGLCLDTGHWTFGGGDPVAALQEHADRVWHVHFKDCDVSVAAGVAERGEDYFAAVQGGVFCELGRGSVDFSAVVQALHAMDYTGWVVVEQDVLPGMGSPLQSAVRNRGFLSRLGL